MKHLLFIPLVFFYLAGKAQCMQEDAPHPLAHKTGEFADDDAIWDIPIVVHVLYANAQDSVPADVIRSLFLDSVNADFRRTNWDTIYTQTAYRPIAVDTRVQFHFATTDPDGNPTDGITYRQTDGQVFNWQTKEMMYDSLGGRDPWDVCTTINIWVCRYTGGKQIVESTAPWNESDRKGLTAVPNVFQPNPNFRLGRHMTHFFGHYMGMRDYRNSNQCADSDWMEDTPIQSVTPSIDLMNPDSIYAETTCDSLPLGRLGCNFMMMTYPNLLKGMNMFTQDQKDYMREVTAFYNPGLIHQSACWPDAVAEVDAGATLLLRPNPTSSQLLFDVEMASDYVIVDGMGRTVSHGTAQPGQNDVTVTSLPDGIYLLRMDATGAVARFVKTSP